MGTQISYNQKKAAKESAELDLWTAMNAYDWGIEGPAAQSKHQSKISRCCVMAALAGIQEKRKNGYSDQGGDPRAGDNRPDSVDPEALSGSPPGSLCMSHPRKQKRG